MLSSCTCVKLIVSFDLTDMGWRKDRNPVHTGTTEVCHRVVSTLGLLSPANGVKHPTAKHRPLQGPNTDIPASLEALSAQFHAIWRAYNIGLRYWCSLPGQSVWCMCQWAGLVSRFTGLGCVAHSLRIEPRRVNHGYNYCDYQVIRNDSVEISIGPNILLTYSRYIITWQNKWYC